MSIAPSGPLTDAFDVVLCFSSIIGNNMIPTGTFIKTLLLMIIKGWENTRKGNQKISTKQSCQIGQKVANWATFLMLLQTKLVTCNLTIFRATFKIDRAIFCCILLLFSLQYLTKQLLLHLKFDKMNSTISRQSVLYYPFLLKITIDLFVKLLDYERISTFDLL